MKRTVTRKTRRQVQRWAQHHIPDQVEQYGEDLLDWLRPARRRRGWPVAYLLLLIAAVAGAVAAVAYARELRAAVGLEQREGAS